MALPRSKYVQEGKEGVYHCFSRCVRRAFLQGFDSLTGRDFSHRRTWIVDRLRQLAAIFAIDVCAYAVLQNHYHTVLRTRPDVAAAWSDQEVASRWLTLFPRRCSKSRAKDTPSIEDQIRMLADCPERIALLRKRLCSLSWFMGRLNEFIARAANKEDEVKGRFWESRFKCQALLDEAAIAACMVYVDLNPIRAGLAATPEESDFTSIQDRIRAWYRETMAEPTVPTNDPEDSRSGSFGNPSPAAGQVPARMVSPETGSSDWLCPIESHRRGILQMTAMEYFALVDASGRSTLAGKRGAVDAGLAPILRRIGAVPDAWEDTVTRFGRKFRLAAGRASSMHAFADQLGRQWVQGVSAARASFTSSPMQD